MNFRDVELLSAYLDGQLSPSDSLQLESRLASDPNLQAVMDDLRTARGLLRQLPQRRAPRNFTLTLKMAGLKAPEPRAYPAFRLATVLAALLFVITFAVNGFAPFKTSHLSAAQAPGYGGGGFGGGGGCENCGASESEPAATEAPMQSYRGGCDNCDTSEPALAGTEAPLQSFGAIAPTEMPPSLDNSLNLATATSESAPKAAPTFMANNPPAPISPQSAPNAAPPFMANNTPAPIPTQIAPHAAAPFVAKNPPAPISTEAPVSLNWQVLIGIVTLTCGAITWFLHLRNEQEFHKRWNKK